MRVLVAVDLGEGSNEAIRQARSWAEGGTLAVVHVMPDVVGTHTLLPHETQSASLHAAELEKRVREVISSKAPNAEIFIETGLEHERIVDRATLWKADLLVVGSHGHGGLERIFGDVADKVVRNAPCATLVARKSPDEGVILAATDLSEASLPAVESAARVAKQTGSTLVLVHVVYVPGAAYVTALGIALGSPPVVPPPDAIAEQRLALKQTLESILARVGVQGQTVIADGTPAIEIVKTAERLRARLVVVATHGSSGLRRIALGSVAERVIRSAPCSVLVERTRA